MLFSSIFLHLIIDWIAKNTKQKKTFTKSICVFCSNYQNFSIFFFFKLTVFYLIKIKLAMLWIWSCVIFIWASGHILISPISNCCSNDGFQAIIQCDCWVATRKRRFFDGLSSLNFILISHIREYTVVARIEFFMTQNIWNFWRKKGFMKKSMQQLYDDQAKNNTARLDINKFCCFCFVYDL